MIQKVTWFNKQSLKNLLEQFQLTLLYINEFAISNLLDKEHAITRGNYQITSGRHNHI